MRCSICKNTNPYFNLATEEYLLKNSEEEIFLLYVNEPCIVVGKHQNLLSEINLPYVLKKKIKLARRISGGGTVYQDFSNLNFSFIHNCKNLEQVNFTNFTRPILEALKEMGLDVEFSGRNDLLIKGQKISGNAMHIYKTRVLSHGTLLFNADLAQLSDALQNNPQRYLDRSIKSVRSKVTNISNYMKNPKSLDEFSHALFQSILRKSDNPLIQPITESESELINKISGEKFESWEWIYGYSPKYQFHNSFELKDKTVKFEIEVEKGMIKEVKTNIDKITDQVYHNAFELLVNTKHDYHTISELLKNNTAICKTSSFNITEFCSLLF